MTKDDCFYLGKVTRLHGYKGNVLIYLDVDNPEEYSELESVLMSSFNMGHELIPFFIEKIDLLNNNTALIKFDGINSEIDAEKIVNSELFLPLTVLPKLSGTKFYFHEIIGFQVIDAKHGVVGLVTSVLPNAQDLLEIKHETGKEILIPITDDFITQVDRENKKLHVSTPDGLIDMYLEG